MALSAGPVPKAVFSTDAKVLLLWDSMTTYVAQAWPAGDYAMWGDGVTRDGYVDACAQLEALLEAGYNVLYTSGADFSVTINRAGHLEITNSSPNEITFFTADYGTGGGFGPTTLDMEIFGFKDESASNEYLIEEFKASDYMVHYNWIPGQQAEWDSGEFQRNDRTQTRLQSGRTVTTKRNDTAWFERWARWQNIPAARVNTDRATGDYSTDFCSAASVEDGDDATLEEFLNHVSEKDTDINPLPDQLYLASTDDVTTHNVAGPYHLDWEASGYLEGVAIDSAVENMSAESYAIAVIVRRVP